MKERATRSFSSANNSAAKEKRPVRPTHANRPYFDASFPAPTSRQPRPLFHEDLSSWQTRVTLRDAESSQLALEELTQKRQERAERQRALILLCLLVLMVGTIHMVTRVDGSEHPKTRSDGSPLKKPRVYSVDERKIDYGLNNDNIDTLDKDSGGVDVNETGNSTKRTNILDHFVDCDGEITENQVPYYFHIPRSGAQTIKEIVGTCLRKVQANELGTRGGHAQDETLAQVTMDGSSYVNVDTSSLAGIERAGLLGLAASNMADMVTSSYFFQSGLHLFSTDHQGRAFTMLRNPIQSAVSMYHYKKSLGVIDSSVSLEDYARGNGIENNWAVRFLTNTMEGELKKHHLDLAKRILSKKFLVGFLDDAAESVARMMNYFDWQYSDDEPAATNQRDCVQKILTEGTNRNSIEYELPQRGSQAHALIAWQTQFDMKLYEFAKALFDLQTKQYGSKERKKELKRKKKGKAVKN